jgi:LacI family transcriptional regulator, repressor for deo operon, udp, cdd, tsx, nupC, and nupG
LTVSQRDVAIRAGVSVRTVSNVVNDFPLVANSTRQRVQRAIDELGYRPNASARNLRRGSSGLIGVAVPELSGPYFSELAGLIVQHARRLHYTVVVEQTDGDIQRERALLADSERSQLFDGLIFSPLALGKDEVRGHPTRVPIVFLGEHIGDGQYDHVGIDNIAAAREATAHLALLGRRRIAAIGHQGGSLGETGKLRTAGYRQALREAALPFRKELLVPARSFHRDSGEVAMEELLSLPRHPDAVFCYNDLLAIGALRAVLTRGLKVPDDVAIVGFDDIEEGRFSFPSLTTVSPDKEEIAQAAIDHLFARMTDQGRPVVSHVSNHQLIARESTLGSTGAQGWERSSARGHPQRVQSSAS